MSHPYIYIGCFVPEDEMSVIFSRLGKPRLARAIAFPHVTFKYRPAEVDESLFGEKLAIRVVGYGNDGSNEGVRVTLSAENAVISRMIGGVAVPHITLSVSGSGKPVNTKFLRFSSVEPFEITGYFGGYTAGGGVVTGADGAICQK